MRLVKHMADVVWLGVWRRLAILGIGDPLNQLLFVAPYSVVSPSRVRVTRYKVVTPKPVKGGQKLLRKMIDSEFADDRIKQLKQKTTTKITKVEKSEPPVVEGSEEIEIDE
jgi:hypothetical protein